MTFIEETEKELYRKQGQHRLPEKEDPFNPKNIDIKKIDYQAWQSEAQFGLRQKTKKIIKIFIALIILGSVAFYGINKYLEYISFSIDKIDLVINGTDTLTSGAQASWQVSVTNRNKSALEDVELIFDFPEGSYVQDSGLLGAKKSAQAKVNLYDIAPNQTVQKEFTARIVAPENSSRSAQATITFKPKGISKEVKKSVKFTTTIKNFPVILTIDAPNETFSNKEIFYKINYINSSQERFNNLRIKVQYPDGFSPNEYDPQPSQEKNIWQIKALDPYQEGQIKIKGILSGNEGDRKSLMVLIEGLEDENFVVFTKETAQTNIISSPLALEVKVLGRDNPSVNAGQKLRYDIGFRNNLNTTLQNLYLTAKLEGTMFKFTTLKTIGYFDVNTNTITWGPREIPALKNLNPKDTGLASFEIELKNIFPILSYNDKNFFVKVSFNIGTKSVPPLLGVKEINQSTDVITKINTNLILQAKAFYRENFSSIINYGPIPPRVGQTTSFTLHWQIINVSNDVEDLVVSATLPTGVQWTNNYYANFKKDGLVFDETTKKITWNVGKVPATTGLANGLPVYEAVFQVAITPGPHQLNQTVPLLDESIATAKDSYTGSPLEVSAERKSTGSLDDLTLKSGDRMVQP
ncbi:MAG: hypothetical protein ABIJ94_01485 [candidate division WOR-3 bacterium]